MPAILRNSLPNLYPLIAVIGSYAGNGVVVGSRPGRPPCGPWRRHVGLQHYEVLSVCVVLSARDIYYGCIGHNPRGTVWHSRMRMIVAYNLFISRLVMFGNTML